MITKIGCNQEVDEQINKLDLKHNRTSSDVAENIRYYNSKTVLYCQITAISTYSRMKLCLVHCL